MPTKANALIFRKSFLARLIALGREVGRAPALRGRALTGLRNATVPPRAGRLTAPYDPSRESYGGAMFSGGF
jgi:hypothetical protein